MPSLIEAEDEAARDVRREHGRPLLLDYAEAEREEQGRLVDENDEWIVVVPYWAVWPFEALILPRRHVRRLPDLDDVQRRDLGESLRSFLARYDNLFQSVVPVLDGMARSTLP